MLVTVHSELHRRQSDLKLNSQLRNGIRNERNDMKSFFNCLSTLLLVLIAAAPLAVHAETFETGYSNTPPADGKVRIVGGQAFWDPDMTVLSSDSKGISLRSPAGKQYFLFCGGHCVSIGNTWEHCASKQTGPASSICACDTWMPCIFNYCSYALTPQN